jgi:hypothetical protein
MKASSFEKIADAQERFRLANGLNQKISGSVFQGASFGLFTDVTSQYHDWQEIFGRVGTKSFQNGKSVDLRHNQVEQDQVGIKIGAGFERMPRIRNPHDAAVTVSLQKLFQQRDRHPVVIDDQNLHSMKQRFRNHGVRLKGSKSHSVDPPKSLEYSVS